MMESIKQYILSLMAAAIFCSILSSWFDSKGIHNAILKLLAGLFMTITFIAPLIRIDISDFTVGLDSLSLDTQAAVRVGQEKYAKDMESIIKERTRAYILDKAAFWELNLEVEVTLSETDPPMPGSVVLIGEVSPYAKSQLSDYISSELGISKENQVWR